MIPLINARRYATKIAGAVHDGAHKNAAVALMSLPAPLAAAVALLMELNPEERAALVSALL